MLHEDLYWDMNMVADELMEGQFYTLCPMEFDDLNPRHPIDIYEYLTRKVVTSWMSGQEASKEQLTDMYDKLNEFQEYYCLRELPCVLQKLKIMLGAKEGEPAREGN